MRRLVASAIVCAVFGVAAGAAFAQSPASSEASCLGILVSWEATTLPPGSVGKEVSAAARSQPGVLGGLARTVAKEHGGSVEACFPDDE